jgi:hypothetical protein
VFDEIGVDNQRDAIDACQSNHFAVQLAYRRGSRNLERGPPLFALVPQEIK